MITAREAILLNLTGGVRLKQRVQHPSVVERKDRGQYYWYFRYREDELLPVGTIKTRRKFHMVGASRGEGALTKKQAEVERDKFLLEVNMAPSRCEAAVATKKPVETRAIIFGKLAELWRKDYVENPKVRLATPTREKYRMRLDNHILRRWKDARLADFEDSKAILDWLQQECTSWHMMVDLRNIMSGIITRAQEWGIIPRSFANPMQWVKIGRKWTVRENRILDDDETAAVFLRLEDPHLLICETCISTGTRISEAVGLQLRHVDLDKGIIKIQQRHCRGDVDEPKTKNSKRTLALGVLTDRYRAWIEKNGISKPNDWIFFQDEDRTKPMWDSGVRKALKQAAEDAGCDFPGFGLHSFRRANITLRQEEGASAIEAQKIAGHATVSMTGDYTVVQLKRQDELTRAIQERLRTAANRVKSEKLRQRDCDSEGPRGRPNTSGPFEITLNVEPTALLRSSAPSDVILKQVYRGESVDGAKS
jgi:integrase